MFLSSIHHYENLTGPESEILNKTSGCSILQKKYIEKNNIERFLQQIKTGIPLFYKIYKDDILYFKKIKLILSKKGLDNFIINMEIIPFLYEKKNNFNFKENIYINNLINIENKKNLTKYKMDPEELIINYTKYMTFDEKFKAINNIKKKNKKNPNILVSLSSRIPENEILIYDVINKTF
tara:strand:- start:55 stop:594 length:540 start_codon:yes stop_codon:yes gene_type:complete